MTAKKKEALTVVALLPAAKESENNNEDSLRRCVQGAIEGYFARLEGHSAAGLYRLVMTEVELPLLEAALRQTRGNQSKAAKLLGINRGTLRKKLKQYHLE